MSSRDFFKRILSGFVESLQPLRQAVASPDAFAGFLNQFGWTLGPSELTQVKGSIGDLSTLSTDPSSLSVDQLIVQITAVAKAIRTIANCDAPAAFISSFPRELLDYLVYSAVAQQSPLLFGILHFIGVMSERRVLANSGIGRAEYIERQVHWDRLAQLADQPLATVGQSYGWGKSFDADSFLRSLGILVRGVGGYAGLYAADRELANQYYARGAREAAGLKNLILSAPLLEASATSGSASANTKLAFLAIPIPLLPDAAAPPDGLALMPMITGKASDSFVISDNVSLKLSGDFLVRPVRAEIHPDHTIVRGSAGDSHVDAHARLDAKTPADTPWIPIGDADSSRLEISALHASLGMIGELDGDVDLRVEVGIDAAALVIDFSEGDSFLQQTVSSQPTRSQLSFVLKWSSKSGFSLGGQPKLQVSLPIQQSLAGVASLQRIDITLGASSSNNIDLDLTLAGSTSVGPLTAIINDVGLRISLASLNDTVPPGNLGNLDLKFGFKPPSGLGIAIDAQAVVGGGFLRFDPQKQEYSGMLELQIAEHIAVKGMGILTTQLPGGASGYSLVVIIFTQGFEPIQLGLGFTLTGIGGLLAINRTFDEAALRAGLKNHTLDSILFPQDPIRNAPQILSNLNKVFPPAKGHHLFGPMAQIAWGTPPLITANLALVLEFGARLRLLILAQVVAILPKRENDLVRLQMDAIGVIDFDQGTAELDATLHDSRLLKKFVLTGDMAMRLKWEGSPNFALAIGGLHPAFNPPPNFPKLERIAINLCAGDNPRFRCEAYFALTSNTVQFGARAELYASASGFSIQGETGFDVLIQLDPFHFLADFYAQLQLKRGSTNLFKVRVEGALSGPRPLHIKAKVTFEILWWDYSVRIDKTLVEGELPPLPEPVDVLPRLKEALGNPGNWKGQLPENQRPMVTLRAKPEAPNEVLLHPLGTLTVKQGVVPLNLDISRFGQAVPAGARRFTISSVSLSDQKQTIQPVKDFFAPAQFLEMSDDEKLSRPSFEPMDAGVSFGSNEFNFSAKASDWLEVKAIAFETIIVDKQTNTSRPSEPEGSKKLYTLSPELLGKQALFGAAGTSDLRRTGKAKYRTTMGKYQVAKEGWSIVATDNLTVQSLPGIEAGKSTTYSEAAQALRKLKQENPAQAGGLKILRLSEIALRVESPGN